MDDIRCPMCGKPNPAEAEMCAFCGARIKPLIAPQGTPPDPDEPEWLAGLRGGSFTQPGGNEPPAAESSPEPEDWLSRIRNRQDEGNEAGDIDWLSQISRQEDSPSLSGLPDWLNPEQPTGVDPAPPLSFADVPAQNAGGLDWATFRSEEHAPETPAEPAGELPDWLSQLTAASFETDQPASSGLPPGQLPAQDAASPEDDQLPAEPAGALPDWLTTLQSTPMGSTSDPESTPVEPAAEPAGEQTDWLAMLQSTPGEASSEMELGPAEPASEPVLETVEPQAEPADNLPDWLDALQSVPVELSSEPEPPAAVLPDEPRQELPDWLAPETAAPAGSPAQSEDASFEDEQAISGAPPAVPSSDSPLPFEGDDLPDWLGIDPDSEQPVVPIEVGDDLEKAQLPGWLQAMRPVEDIVPDVAAMSSEEQTIEPAGPLRGLVGALPGEDLVLRYRKPPVYSARLQVSDRQRQNAALFEELLPAESQPQAVRASRRRVPQQFMRIVVALILLLAVLYPLVTGSRIMPTPMLYPPEIVALNTGLAALAPGSTVLLAVDYEPGLSGEMRLAASPVVDQLMSRQARLAVVSTVPTGPVLAEALLAQAGQAHPDYSLNANVVNLGFLAGGTTGLQEFARRPQLSRPFTLDGFAAWSHPALSGITSLQNFSAVVVLTESAETARAWIEQIHPALGTVPLFMVASAQSAPMIQPYIESGQVQGMLSGYAGGVMYAQILQQAPGGSAYWDAYQIGLFLVVVFILIGGVAQLFSWLAAQRARARKG